VVLQAAILTAAAVLGLTCLFAYFFIRAKKILNSKLEW
jgi:hypothetical protein